MEEKNDFICPDTYSISIRQVMPFLLDMSYEEIKKGVKPSTVTAALKLTTEKRLERLRCPLRKYKIGTKMDIFSRSPEAIIFQNWHKGVSYTTPLIITNQRTVPQNLKVYFETSRHFSFSMDSELNHQTKVAPGMSYIINITFLPTDQFRDYVRELKIMGDDQTFTIPVLGLGPRPICEMPDKIIFPPTLVKVESSATVLIKNTGMVPMIYVQIVDKPFYGTIPKAIVPPAGILELKYNCYPDRAGYIAGRVNSYFRNELCIVTELECEVHSARVQLGTYVVAFKDVYMGLSSRNKLVLYNTSEYTLNFSWKMHNEEEEKEESKKLIDLMTELKDYQIPKSTKLEFLDIVDAKQHADIYERILEDEKTELLSDEKGPFLFQSSYFDIIPKVGRVLPKSKFDFFVIFSPDQNIGYYCNAYLDIEGTEKRVRVSLQGYGVGPPVMLCVKRLNASQIYLTDKHQYELAVKNKGVIAATVTYKPKQLDWGGVLDCIPKTLVLDPDSTKAFVVLFHSEVQGEFIETLDFRVEESNEPLQCISTGTVICPLLRCVPETLNLGTVSVGLQHLKELWLVNESRVMIDFEIEIEEALNKVLNIVPLYGSVKPHSRIKVLVTFVCGSISEWKKNVLLIMWNSRQYTKTIPFECICSCPEMTCTPDVINIKFCFLNCEYTRVIKIKNHTSLPGHVEYKPVESSEEPAIRCIPQKTKIFLKANESVEILLKIIVTELGHHKLPLYFAVIGNVPQRLCKIYCNGQGPVISYHPDEVNFGRIDVLRRASQPLTLINDSPISAKVRVYCKNKSSFNIEDSIVELAPEESRDVEISAVFNNAGKIKDSIYLEIFQSDIFTIKVSGEGVGTSIICEPPLSPKLNLGSILTYKKFSQEVFISNKSSFTHKLLFSKQPTVKHLKEEEDQTGNIFTLEPHYLELESNEESKILIKCFSKKSKVCGEEYFCHALIGKSVQPVTILDFIITAVFVDPSLNFSRTEFNFHINVRGSQTDGYVQDVLLIENKTGIPLQVYVTIDDNFSILDSGERAQQIVQGLNDGSQIMKDIEYCPTIKEKRRYQQQGRIIFEYENHPKTDIINLFGEVMFPTVKLLPVNVDFQCIPLGSTSYRTVVIHNISAMEVSFKWLWLEKSIVIKELEPRKAKKNYYKSKSETSGHSKKSFMDYVDYSIDIKDKPDNATQDESEQITVDSRSELTTLCYDTNKYLEEMRKVLFPVLTPFKEQCKEDLCGAPSKQSYPHDIHKLFSLEPSEGILQPAEYSLVTIGFNPSPNTDVMATAICKVFGGEEELLIIKGKSSSLSYILDKNCVNYGNQVFCEICSDALTLTNNGLCSIDFKVLIEETMHHHAEMLDVNPKTGLVHPGDMITFKVEYLPGFPGKFEKSFMLELGYLEPVTIKVQGYAVVNQVYLHAPRLDMELSISDCYKALALITPDYLKSVQNRNNTPLREDDPIDPTSFLVQHDWTYISQNDLYPSLMDINLAMERIAALNHVSKNKNILFEHTLAKKKIQYIPQFYPSPYCVDFGYVIIGIPVCYTILLYNYGPIKADVRLVEDNKTALLEKEFKIEFKNKVLLPGETTELYVLFSPTRRRCKELNIKLEDVFYLTVSHGPIISVKLIAVVTLPSLYLEYDALYFEKVYCGDVLRKSIVLTNDGNVPSKWCASISRPTRKDVTSTFLMIPQEGQLLPNQKTHVDIYFVAHESRKTKRTLQIDIEANSDPIMMDLYGEGLESILEIVPMELKFQSTISFFEQTSFFTVQNLSNIPLEFYFPTLDKTSEEEKTLIRIYLKYKNLKNILVPFRQAGEKLPEFFAETYERLVEKLRNRMSQPNSAVDGVIDLMENNAATNSVRNSDPIEDIFAKYTSQELNNLIIEYISADGFDNDFSTKATTYQLEESNDLIEIVEPLQFVTEPTERSSILLIFHGAPTTDYYKAACQVGIALSFPVYSIDRLIIESLVENTHPCSVEIKEIIDQAFTELTSSKSSINLLNHLEKEDNAYDQIMDKITVILTTKPKKRPKKASTPKEKGSKASSDKSQSKNKDKATSSTECFLNLSPDTIIDLLRPKLKQFPYLIIESLNSTFFIKENASLYTILKAAGAIEHIQLVILSHTIHDYVRNEEAKINSELVEDETSSPQRNITFEKNMSKDSNPKENVGKENKSSSEKKSKSSPTKTKGGIDLSKKILQGLNKSLKADLEKFEELLREILHISENWDRTNAVLKKPYNGKSSAASRRETANKDSIRTVRSSVKRLPSSTNDDNSLITNESGLYLWVILNGCRDRSIEYPETIKNCFLINSEFQFILNDIKTKLEETFEESETVFSVISEPNAKTNTLSPAFIISNFKDEEDIEYKGPRRKSSEPEVKVKRRKSSKSSKRSVDSKTSIKLIDAAKLKNDKELEFSTKCVLNPEEVAKYQVRFSPVKCGKYNQKYTLETTKTRTIYDIHCSAVCEYPKIDFKPEVMFPKVLENYREKASYDHFVFIRDQKIFDFGSVIVGSNMNECQVYCSDIILRNSSSSICQATMSLSNDNFYVEPDSLVISPKSDENLKVGIKPIKTGVLTTQICFSIKNNPKIEEFTLACTPCKLEFSISPKSIGFDKIPVRYRAKRAIKMTNSSPINLRWELSDADWINEIFDLSEVKGYIGLYSVTEINFYFAPKEELSLPKKHFLLKVFDVNSANNEPCFVESLTIHADSVEYNLEIENLINFGEIKGGVESKYHFPVINKGKCEVAFKIQLIDNPLEHTNFVREFFKINPQVLNIGALKTEYISVVFHPICDLSVYKLLLFVINMMESVQSEQIVKSYKVYMSATVFMPSYKLCPQSQLNFGHVQLLSTKKMIFKIKNTGKFAFSFILVNYAKFLESYNKGAGKKGKKEKLAKSSTQSEKSVKNDDEKKSIKNKDSAKSDKKSKNDKEAKEKSETSKGTKSTKMDKKKMKITKLEVDGFSIVPSSGIVDPNETFEISVEFNPREAKEHQEELLLNIAEIPDLQKKKVLTFKGSGCEPQVNIRDLDNVFIEQYVVENIDAFKPPKYIENYCVFVTSEIALYFKLVCVNTSKTILLHFKNIGFVTANLTVKVDDYGKNVFSVTPPNKKIEPYSSCIIEVTFKPDSLEVIRGVLEISYNRSTDNKLIVQLFGEACLPQIRVLKPIPENNEPFLNFGPVCVGHSKKEKISFKNVGSIKCQVIVEIGSNDGVFQIKPCDNTYEKLNVQDEECITDMKQHLLVNLKTEEEAEFEIIFKPIKQQLIIDYLNLHTVNNPFEMNKIFITADGYYKDVIIDDLEPMKLNVAHSSKSSLISRNVIGYSLNFGFRELNKPHKMTFSIRNQSNIETYKFKFQSDSVIFTPETGHLKPHACKEIIVIFRSKEPVLKEMEEIDCDLRKIEYVTPNTDLLSWDDRQKFVYWTTDNQFLSISQELNFSTAEKQENTLKSYQIKDSLLKAPPSEFTIDNKSYASSGLLGKSSNDSISEIKDRMITEGMEPDNITVPDFMAIIPLYLSVSADYSRYICERSEIKFPDTYIEEKNIQYLKVKNTGAVPLKIKWSIFYKSTTLSIKRSNSSSSISMFDNKLALPLQSFSSTSLISSEESIRESDIFLPFSLCPVDSVIEPGKSQNFEVIFTPKRVDMFRGALKSCTEALDPSYQEMCVSVDGKALPIPFYFENEDNSYRYKDLSLKFESVGSGIQCYRKVFLVNPSDEPFTYQIDTEKQKEFSYFACETPTGKINGKKKTVITFSFLPQIFGSFEMNYLLKIPEKNVINNISLEGVCREPRVYFTENKVILKPTVPKVKTVKLLELVNEEIFPVSFKFIKKSQFDESQKEKLEIFPIVGKLKPESKTEIRITYLTSNTVRARFHLKCMVEKFKLPLVLYVVANCLNIESNVSYSDKYGKVTVLSKDEVNTIDIGHTHKGRKEELLFEISNEGQTGMFYSWLFDSKPIAHLFKLSVDVDKGFIKKGASTSTRMQLEALRLSTLKQFKMQLNILYGPNYIIYLNAISDKPIYSFSFNDHNFGCCFVQKGKTKYYRTILTFRNLDAKPIVLENLFENSEYLSVDFTSSNVSAGNSKNIPIFFHPQKVGLNKADIIFLIGTMKHTIPVAGEGVQVKLELENSKDKFIYFKDVLLGTVKKYRVAVVNNTPARMEAHFSLFDNLETHKRKIEKLENIDMKMPSIPPPPKDAKKGKDDKKRDKSTDTKAEKQKAEKKTDKGKKQKEEEKELEIQKATEALLKQKEEERNEYLESFMIIPNMFIDIPPFGKNYFEIIFQPSKKMTFEEKVYFETQDYFEPLCIIKGQSVSAEFSLDSTEMFFSSVIVNRSRTKIMSLQNTGDILGSFIWTIEDKRNIFNIEPRQGFVMPKSDMKIRVTFSPKQEKCEYKVKAKCKLKEYKEPLQLLLKGNSVKVPEAKETIMFSCNVREQATKSVAFTNTTSEIWTVYPEISNECFSVPKEITALPFIDTQISITFAPKTMTVSQPHEATMFLELPNGESFVYKLIGNAEPPSVSKKIEKDIRCKQNNYETLSIQNWLHVKQNFKVTTEVISPVTTRTLYRILGLKNIQLDGMEKKQYQWGVYLVNDIVVEFRVTFKNPENGEYLYYDITVKGLPSEPIDIIYFNTRVREPMTKQFTLVNPVDVPITFAIDCPERNLTCNKSIRLEPYTTTKVDLVYSPLQTEEISTSLTAKCEELGLYTYSVKLHADPPSPEKEVIFKADLGEKVVKTILFKNSFDRAVEFSYKFDHEDFSMERCGSISVGESSKISISFDPSSNKSIKSKLFLNSAVAGEYIYPLLGESLAPKPKGPFAVRQNYPTPIEFKNPFNEERSFVYQLQSDVFYTEINEEVIKPKKSTRILIYVHTPRVVNLSYPVTGKLTVHPVDQPNLEWTYYLQFNHS